MIEQLESFSGSNAPSCSGSSERPIDADYLEYRIRCHCGEKTEDDYEIYESEYDDE